MGLDIYFERVKDVSNFKKADSFLEEIDRLSEKVSDESLKDELGMIRDRFINFCRESGATTETEVGYFRKAYFVLEFFGYVDNCSRMSLSYDDLNDFHGALNEVLSLDKDDYSEEDYNEKVYNILSLSSDCAFWYDNKPYEVHEEDLERMRNCIEDCMEYLQDGECIVLVGWW